MDEQINCSIIKGIPACAGMTLVRYYFLDNPCRERLPPDLLIIYGKSIAFI